MRMFACTVIRSPFREYLMLYHADKQSWRFPGGKIELGETATDCAVRELMEETELFAKEPRYVGAMHLKIDSGDWLGYIHTASVFKNTPINREPGKHTQMSWRTRRQVAADAESGDHAAMFNLACIDRAALSPVQINILKTIREYSRSHATQEQMAASIALQYITWKNELSKIKKQLCLDTRHLAAWEKLWLY